MNALSISDTNCAENKMHSNDISIWRDQALFDFNDYKPEIGNTEEWNKNANNARKTMMNC